MRHGWETAARCAAGEPARLHPEMRYAYIRVAEVFAVEAEWVLHHRLLRRSARMRPYDIPLAVAVLPFTDFRLAAGARDPYGTIAARLAALLDQNQGDPLDRYSWELAERCLQGETVVLKPETREVYAAVGRLFEVEMRFLLHGDALPAGLDRPYDAAEAIRHLPFRAFRQAAVGADPYGDISRRLLAFARENTVQGARRYLHRLRWRLARTHAWTPGQIRRVWSIVLRFPDLVPVLGRITDLFPPPVELPVGREGQEREVGIPELGKRNGWQWGNGRSGPGDLSNPGGQGGRECGGRRPAMSVGEMLAVLQGGGQREAAVSGAAQDAGFFRQGAGGGDVFPAIVRAVLPGMPLSELPGPAVSARQDGLRSARSPRRRRKEMADQRLTLF